MISSSQIRTSLADHSCLHLQVLNQGMKANVDSIQGWQLLSQLQLQNQQYDLAAESAAKGLKCLHQRQKRGYRSQPAIAAGIVSARAHSLLHLGLLDDAVALFEALSEMVVAPLDGTPDDQGLNATSEGGKENKSGGPRRKVGRWSEEETNTLIMLTNQVTDLHATSFPSSCVTWELLYVNTHTTCCAHKSCPNRASICRQIVKASLIWSCGFLLVE